MSAVLSIAAVVATHNRPALLGQRALASISFQTRLPDYLVVADDSDLDARRTNAEIVAHLNLPGVRTIYLENQRTSGASGAWNTALAQLQGIDPATFVAILDDDDSWDATYLEQCERAVLERDLDMVTAGLVFRRSGEQAGIPLDPPQRLNVHDLLVRNSGIQGSNLYARLRTLLEAGGFDESLVSTTDRDMCIRLADLGTVRFGSLNRHLVHHFADDDRPRLSTPGGEAKRAGLNRFYRKYRGRMSDEQQEAFIERSLRRFDCDPTEPAAVPSVVWPVSDRDRAADPLFLVVGIITSPETSMVERLLNSLSEKVATDKTVVLKVVLLENGGPEPGSREALSRTVDRASQRGLDVVVKSLEQQAADVEASVFDTTLEELSQRKSIALSRTMLQHYLFMEAKPLQGSVAWILDDDVVLEGLTYGSDASPQPRDIDYASEIKSLKRSGASIVLCEVTGDPPLPALSCVRSQLVDLYHNLHRLATMSPDASFPHLGNETALARLENPEYYYDLSSNGTSHLELPFWYQPTEEDLTAALVYRELVARLPAILSGIQVFRPLLHMELSEPDPALFPSINRGPATLVFDLQALREFPNAVPTVHGMDLRRGDMVWSLLNQYVGGREVLRAPLPVRQVRDARRDPGMLDRNFTIMRQDLLGYAFYSSLRDLLLEKAGQRAKSNNPSSRRNLLTFSDDEIERLIDTYRKYLHERLAGFELNFIRIMGLASALRKLCQAPADGGEGPWWLESAQFAEASAELLSFVETLASTYTDARLNEFKRLASEGGVGEVRAFLQNLPETVDRYRATTPLPMEELRKVAERYVREEFRTGPLTCLGGGEEGIVLTDGRLAYKYFHDWKAPNRGAFLPFLQSLAGRLCGYRSLPDLLEVRQRGEHLIVVCAYEMGTSYEGGRLGDLLTLLREAREAGIACRNIHPDNLIVTSSGLKLVDYGSDIVPMNDAAFDQMCRRAFLTYRFPFRSDLKRLMTDSLSESFLPELTGLDAFRRALDPRGLDELYFQPMAELVASEGPNSVLDYGCGNGRLAEELARLGIDVVGYDPNPGYVSRCLRQRSSVTYGGRELLEELLAKNTRSDTVVCGRVLCTVTDESELLAILADLRRLVSDSGTVFLTVCNPFHTSTESTELWQKHRPLDHVYGETFVYDKTVAATGRTRKEVHRSYSAYRAGFSRPGFQIDRVMELDGTDTEALLPSSDHLVFWLTPGPVDAPNVSLLIKTCAMEWRMIERLVRHQVGQLENPVPFVEKVVVVDTFGGPFARQYEQPDAEAHRAAMARLLSHGVVDRVVYAPTEPEAVRETYRKWFGVESAKTHSANGQQLFATLFGIDSCSGDYVLQLDSDLLMVRRDHGHDYLGEMAEVLRSDPMALFVPMSICREDPVPYTHEGPDGDWRVEVRGCLLERERLQAILPVPNHLEADRFALPWHRALDRFVASTQFRSYRGGDPRTSYIHVPNGRKSDHSPWSDIIDSVERGHVPAAQMGRVELTGSISEWTGPKRYEPFVFVICGHNVEPGRFKRCFLSLIAQAGDDWGAVVVDDASTNGFGDYAGMLLAEHANRVTLVQNGKRRGGLYNTWNAIANLCGDPESVIITLDADDALLGGHVLERVRAEYQDGADVTVGSMVRLDKQASYPVNFDSPRRWDSNVWQHLRTFRKRLFDALDVDDLKIDGEWIDLATDWAFMVPIVEMASSPRHITEPMYLYEPAVPKNDHSRRLRDSIIGCILGKHPYSKLP